jgi:hypothetical protein
LILIDSAEMLAHLPDEPFILKVEGFYPRDCGWLFEKYRERIDTILCYSVLHYVFVEASIFTFLDRSLGLMAHGGQMLVGDIPNISKRKRFFSSPAGIAHHKAFIQTDEQPVVQFNVVEPDKIDDTVMLSLVMRCRTQGFDAFIVPQADDLPMANRREDILINRP